MTIERGGRTPAAIARPATELEAQQTKVELYLRQLGNRWRAGEFGSPTEQRNASLETVGQVAQRDFLADLPEGMEKWLEQWVWVARGKGRKGKSKRVIAFLAGARILGVAEDPSRLSRAEAIVKRRQAKQKQKPHFDPTWSRPSKGG